MNALLFSDLHESYLALDKLDKLLEKMHYDPVIFAGDFLNMGETVGFAKTFADLFKKHNSTLLWVPGNNDFGRGYHTLNAQYRSLEGRVVETFEKKFSGVGGSPASWAGQYAGEKMTDEKLIAGSIFVSHVPPPGVLNYQKNDCHSPATKKFSNSPSVHICGHIHSRWGCAYLGQTKVVKLAPLLYGHYAILDLDTFAVEFKRFYR